MKYSQTTGVFERPRTPTGRIVTTTVTNIRPTATSPSPMTKKYSFRAVDKSHSPARLAGKLVTGPDYQKEYLEALKEEQELSKRIKLAQQENESLVNIRAKQTNTIGVQRAKYEEEKNQIIDLFADFVIKRNIVVEFPRSKSPLRSSIRSVVSRARDKSETNISRSGLNSPGLPVERASSDLSTGDSKTTDDECNFLIKYLLKDSQRNRLPSNLRALNRSANLNL